MNILFVEDEVELRASAVAQLELKGHHVYPTNDLAESRAILDDADIRIDLIISDHMLPDGFGIEFAMEVREKYPKLNCVIVSGCLTPDDIGTLEQHGISYYHKPLIYGKVIDEMRRKAPDAAPVYSAPEPEPAESLSAVEAEPEVVEAKKKKRFGFW